MLLYSVYPYALRLVTTDFDTIRNAVYITDRANICESGYYASTVNGSKYATRALKGMLNLDNRSKSNVRVHTQFNVNWNKFGFTSFTAHNGTVELLNVR